MKMNCYFFKGLHIAVLLFSSNILSSDSQQSDVTVDQDENIMSKKVLALANQTPGTKSLFENSEDATLMECSMYLCSDHAELAATYMKNGCKGQFIDDFYPENQMFFVNDQDEKANENGSIFDQVLGKESNRLYIFGSSCALIGIIGGFMVGYREEKFRQRHFDSVRV
mmetsp:Transcript_22529/g.29481  ORF Transcript_22529/g.29481 Transcript_22529/m.29481 type:complete len:168 (+) Transcript_22529:107-610(+)